MSELIPCRALEVHCGFALDDACRLPRDAGGCLTHRCAASSILALSTHDGRCDAEKAVIDWCSIKPCVTGAAQKSGPRHLRGLFFQLFAHLAPAAEISMKICVIARHCDVLKWAHVAIAQQTLA